MSRLNAGWSRIHASSAVVTLSCHRPTNSSAAGVARRCSTPVLKFTVRSQLPAPSLASSSGTSTQSVDTKMSAAPSEPVAKYGRGSRSHTTSASLSTGNPS